MHIHAQEESGADREVDVKLSGSDVKFESQLLSQILSSNWTKVGLSEGGIGPNWAKLALSESGIGPNLAKLARSKAGIGRNWAKLPLSEGGLGPKWAKCMPEQSFCVPCAANRTSTGPFQGLPPGPCVRTDRQI